MRWVELHVGKLWYLAHADTEVGTWAVHRRIRETMFKVSWFPPYAGGAELLLGYRKTARGGQMAAKRYAKQLAAGFKTMAKAGWQ